MNPRLSAAQKAMLACLSVEGALYRNRCVFREKRTLESLVNKGLVRREMDGAAYVLSRTPDDCRENA